jgi:hypothetical protein
VTWLPVDAYHWRHECGRYTVDQAAIPGSKTGMRYCAWFKAHEDAAPELLGCRDYELSAKRRCETHLHEHSAPEDQTNEQTALAL